MSFGKLIMPIILRYLTNRANDSGFTAQAKFLNAVTDTVKKEISELILKIVLGLVATSVLIYSLVILGQHFHAYLLLYNNGPLLAVLFFVLLSAACVFTVFKLFYQRQTSTDPFEFLLSKDQKHFSVENIYNNFISGLADGLREHQTEEKTSHKNIEDTGFKYSDTTH